VTVHDSGLLDTSALIQLGRIDATQLPRRPLISTITLAELSVGPLLSSDEGERAIRQAYLQQAEAHFEPLPFDAAAARSFGQVAASLRRSGRKTAARGFDAMIAAIALARELPLYTGNPRDFDGIEGLEVVRVVPSGPPPAAPPHPPDQQGPPSAAADRVPDADPAR
jgi:tRNA(fMet)-specific endonuclease VapC